MSVSDALESFLRANPLVAADPVAAAAVSLAVELDRQGDPATATACLKLMGELRRLAPDESAGESKVDELQRRRAAKMGAAGT